MCTTYCVYVCVCCLSRALKKLNEKKQVFNMYKTQKAKEEKVRGCGQRGCGHSCCHGNYRRRSGSRRRRIARNFAE